MLLRHIHYFLAVAEHRSFTRAAAALFVSQPALSQQIRQLEEKLGAVLLDRSGREMRLTDAGEVYYRYARRALQDLSEGERAIHDVQDLSRGELRIAITPTFISYLVGPLVQRFFQAYPCVGVNIQEMSQERIEEGLLDDAFDLGIAFDEVRSPDIATQPLHREMLALVVNEQHPLANSPVIAAHQLAGEALILLNETFATRGQIDRYCRHQQVQANIVMQANSLSAVLEVIRSTPLATLLPANIANLQAGLKAISLQPALLERQVVLLHRDGSHQSRAARAFSELTRDYCEGELSDSAPG